MSGYLSGVISQLLINVIVAYSVFLPASAGLLNLGAAGFVLVGAYVSGGLTTLLGWPLAAAVPAGGLAAGLLAFAVSFPVLRTRGVFMVLATFAVAEVVGGILINIEALGGASGLSVTAYAGPGVVFLVAVATVGFVAWLLSTRIGLAMRAVHDDEQVAELFGVHLRLVQVLAFSLGGGIGGLAGALLIHHFNFLDVQTTGASFSIYVLLYVLLGGTQTVWGPIAGAAFFTAVPELLRQFAGLSPALHGLEAARFIVFGVAVVVIMVLRPQGLVTRAIGPRRVEKAGGL